MKYLLMILIMMKVHCGCTIDEYEWNGFCLHCSSSPCAVCDGTSLCARCHDGMGDRTRCDGCPFSTSMIINGRCRRCSEINADSDNKGNCRCKLSRGIAGWFGSRQKCCDNVAGVYSESSTCKSCSSQLAGCNECDPNINGVFRCTRCFSNFNRVSIGAASICTPIGFDVYPRPQTRNHSNNNNNTVIIIMSEATHLVFTGFLIPMLIVLLL